MLSFEEASTVANSLIRCGLLPVFLSCSITAMTMSSLMPSTSIFLTATMSPGNGIAKPARNTNPFAGCCYFSDLSQMVVRHFTVGVGLSCKILITEKLELHLARCRLGGQLESITTCLKTSRLRRTSCARSDRIFPKVCPHRLTLMEQNDRWLDTNQRSRSQHLLTFADNSASLGKSTSLL